MEMVRTLNGPDGFDPEIGRWYAGLESVRDMLVRSVEDLSTEALAQRAFAGANSIGTLLIHIAEAELFWIQEVLQGEPLTGQQREEYRFDLFGRPDAPQVEARDFGFFRKRLETVRSRTRTALRDLSDSDLVTERRWTDGEGGERVFSVSWILHHVLEHEAHHRGQIALLKSALGI